MKRQIRVGIRFRQQPNISNDPKEEIEAKIFHEESRNSVVEVLENGGRGRTWGFNHVSHETSTSRNFFAQTVDPALKDAFNDQLGRDCLVISYEQGGSSSCLLAHEHGEDSISSLVLQKIFHQFSEAKQRIRISLMELGTSADAPGPVPGKAGKASRNGPGISNAWDLLNEPVRPVAPFTFIESSKGGDRDNLEQRTLKRTASGPFHALRAVEVHMATEADRMINGSMKKRTNISNHVVLMIFVDRIEERRSPQPDKENSSPKLDNPRGRRCRSFCVTLLGLSGTPPSRLNHFQNTVSSLSNGKQFSTETDLLSRSFINAVNGTGEIVLLAYISPFDSMKAQTLLTLRYAHRVAGLNTAFCDEEEQLDETPAQTQSRENSPARNYVNKTTGAVNSLGQIQSQMQRLAQRNLKLKKRSSQNLLDVGTRSLDAVTKPLPRQQTFDEQAFTPVPNRARNRTPSKLQTFRSQVGPLTAQKAPATTPSRKAGLLAAHSPTTRVPNAQRAKIVSDSDDDYFSDPEVLDPDSSIDSRILIVRSQEDSRDDRQYPWDVQGSSTKVSFASNVRSSNLFQDTSLSPIQNGMLKSGQHSHSKITAKTPFSTQSSDEDEIESLLRQKFQHTQEKMKNNAKIYSGQEDVHALGTELDRLLHELETQAFNALESVRAGREKKVKKKEEEIQGLRRQLTVVPKHIHKMNLMVAQMEEAKGKKETEERLRLLRQRHAYTQTTNWQAPDMTSFNDESDTESEALLSDNSVENSSHGPPLLQQEMSRLTEQLMAVEAERDNYRTELGNVAEEVPRLKAELKILRVKVKEQQEEIDAQDQCEHCDESLREVGNLKRQLQAQEEDLSNYQIKMEKAKTERNEWETHYTELEGRFDKLRDSLWKAEKEAETLKEGNFALNESMAKMTAEKEELKVKLGAQNSDMEILKKTNNDLEEKLLKAETDNVLTVRDKDAERTSLERKLKTKEKEFEISRKSSERDIKATNAALKSCKSQIEEQQKELAQLRRASLLHQDEASSFAKESKVTASELSKETSRRKQLESQNRDLNKERRRLETDLLSLQQQISHEQAASSKLKLDLEAMKKGYGSLQERFAETDNDRAVALNLVDKLKTEVQIVKENEHITAAQVRQVKEENNMASQAIEQSHHDISQLYSQLHEEELKRNSSEALCNKLQKQLNDQLTLREESETQVVQLNKLVQKLKKELEEYKQVDVYNSSRKEALEGPIYDATPSPATPDWTKRKQKKSRIRSRSPSLVRTPLSVQSKYATPSTTHHQIGFTDSEEDGSPLLNITKPAY